MNHVIHAMQALRRGYELSHVEAWKNVGVATASLTGLLSALTGLAVSAGWLPETIPEQTLMEVSSAIVALVGAFLGYLQLATSARVGFGAPVPATEEHAHDSAFHSARTGDLGSAGALAADRVLPPATDPGPRDPRGHFADV